ncbi:formate dehydrogenase subunit delta [Pararhizobium capsulatum DSM 1112]|uniref:Formate dehydrogenase subunit delta n=1 Tax=Pararhizobium capsulatum DSM 1112 TaxID=1121113 RepID=A0ABU0BI18_9HYPH|nr:formate dehydrogenase subunit delta [Pararhizobium capsulatum]MDQ0317894.1 formate dehydrogenase subunit delta [Pararhizobium capsulatum DSM 1112]
MSHDEPHKTTDDKLVYMANQIATFFKSQPEGERAAGIAGHINKFWEQRMRRAFFAMIDKGDPRFDPLVVAAATHIKRPADVGQTTQA